MPLLSSKRRLTIKETLICALLILLLPIHLLPLLLLILTPDYSLKKEYRRKRRIADFTPCACCGVALGEESLKLGEQEWTAWMHRHRSPEGWLPRTRRMFHAVCPSCNAFYYFVKHNELFVLVPAPRS